MREDGDEHADGGGEREKGNRVRAALAAEAPVGGGACQVGYYHHPEGLRRENKHRVDSVGREEAVGLRRPPELLREQRAGPGSGEREHDLREAGEESTPQGAPAHRTIKADDLLTAAGYATRVRVLVTGGAGFLGSHVVERLHAGGVDPFVPRRAEYDLTAEADVVRLFAVARPEIVIHLAAEVGGIGANRANPGRYWYANLLMGAHVLEQSRVAGVPKVVLLGTICAYPKFAPIPFHEDDLWDGYPEETNAPYGIAKKALLVGAQGYREQYGTNAVYLLPVNLYGQRDNFDLETSHVIPALIRKMIDAQERGEREIVLWGDGSPTREFLYVDDCAEAILLAADRFDGAEPVNLGTGQEISIRELAELIGELTDFGGEIVWDTTKPNGQPRRRLDVSRAEALFGFRARTTLRDGLAKTIEWYRQR
jgi:GDP-L-fucose synthase